MNPCPNPPISPGISAPKNSTRRTKNAPGASDAATPATDAAAPTATERVTSPPPAKERTKPAREYKLVPITAPPVTKAAEKQLRLHLRLKEQAGDLFAKAEEALLKALAITRGSGPKAQRVIKPGVVYQFSAPVSTSKGVKHTFQVKDNFEQPEVSKMCRFNRYAVGMWKGDGPVADRAARDAGKAVSFGEEDTLP